MVSKSPIIEASRSNESRAIVDQSANRLTIDDVVKVIDVSKIDIDVTTIECSETSHVSIEPVDRSDDR